MPSIVVNSGSDWTFDDLYNVYDEIEEVGLKEMGYNIYTNQVEVISAEQMLDAYSSIGMPIFYNHWSFGKHFVQTRDAYRKGLQGLAYEIVINSDPCIVYIMEQNTLMMQTLVMAHAGIGHNHFFKNNQLFTDWTKASNIIDYLQYAKHYVSNCEEQHGIIEVEKILDAAHALMQNGVFKYPHKEPLSLKKEKDRKITRALDEEKTFNDLWRTIPEKGKVSEDIADLAKRQMKLRLPEENLLYFLETWSPKLVPWQREIIRIVRNIGQYFYPQAQDKIMNEGCATWTHYTILKRLHEKGVLTDGAWLEFMKSHTSVVFQPSFDSKYYSGINPYALGFAMMNDIVRICDEPTEEDREWFPHIAGCKDHFNVLKETWANYRDESFIRQYLSPKVMRDMKLFTLKNNTDVNHYVVEHIHNERGYRKLRTMLADEFTLSNKIPAINVWDVNLTGDRELNMNLTVHNGVMLEDGDAALTLKHVANLWGYPAKIAVNTEDGILMKTYYKSAEDSSQTMPDDFSC